MTTVLALSPGIKKMPNLEWKKIYSSVDMILITNPIYQNSIISSNSCLNQKIRILSDELVPKVFIEDINALCRSYARTWFLEKPVNDLLNWRDVNLGSLFTRDVTYYLLGVMKSLTIMQEVLKHYSVESLIICGDGSYWEDAWKWVCKTQGIDAMILRNNLSPMSEFHDCASIATKRFLKRIIRFFFNPFLKKSFLSEGMLFSSSLKFVDPFLKDDLLLYYLREHLSLEAVRLSKKYHFTHFVADDFSPKIYFQRHSYIAPLAFHALDAYFSKNDYFQFQGLNFWPLIQNFFRRLIHIEFPKYAQYICAFERMFEKLRVSAVVVDEDVCAFNKTLVSVAKRNGLRSFVLLHGVPYFDVGNLPLTADQVFVWGESSKRRFIEWGVEPVRIIVAGAPQYDRFKNFDKVKARSNLYQDFKIPFDSKIIFLASQPFHTNEHPDFLGTPLTDQTLTDVIETTLKTLKSLEKDSYLVIKFHPSERHEWFTYDIIRRSGAPMKDRIRLVRNYDTAMLIAGSDLVLTFGSTVFFEALLLKAPVFLYDYGSRRYFNFMREKFLNLDAPQTCIQTIKTYLESASGKQAVDIFDEDLESHFYKKNYCAKTEIKSHLFRARIFRSDEKN